MPFLLDTHTFLWFAAGSDQLPKTVISKIKNIAEPCFISLASFWEIAIKLQLGKLHLDIDFSEPYRFAERNQIEILQIHEGHLTKLLELKNHHSDPFDRIIIAQAITEDLVLLSKDKKMDDYNVKLEWD